MDFIIKGTSVEVAGRVAEDFAIQNENNAREYKISAPKTYDEKDLSDKMWYVDVEVAGKGMHESRALKNDGVEGNEIALTWNLGRPQTSFSGKVLVQFYATDSDGEYLFNTKQIELEVKRSNSGVPIIPSNPQSVDLAWEATGQAEQFAADAEQSATEAAGAAEAAKEAAKPPYIGENGNWFVVNRETGEYSDSGKSSKGTSAGVTTYVATTLQASKWTGTSPGPYTYNLETQYPIKQYDLEVRLSRKKSNFTMQHIEEWAKALIVGDSDVNNNLYAYGQKPTVDIPVTLKVVKYS